MRTILMLAVLALLPLACGQAPPEQRPWSPGPDGAGRSLGVGPNVASGDPAFARAMLDAHNAVRAQVRVPPLMWSDRLAEAARYWAGVLVRESRFDHSPNNRYGENLFEIEGARASPAAVVGDWAEEARYYDVRRNSCADVCGHYTQIVWARTRAVGCAVAAAAGREVWVCEYDPPGNYVGERPY